MAVVVVVAVMVVVVAVMVVVAVVVVVAVMVALRTEFRRSKLRAGVEQIALIESTIDDFKGVPHPPVNNEPFHSQSPWWCQRGGPLSELFVMLFVMLLVRLFVMLFIVCSRGCRAV